MTLSMTLLKIAIAVAMGYWCSLIAKKEERSPEWAWLWGLLFGILAVVGYYIAGDSKQKKELIRRLLEENKKAENKGQ